MRLKLRHKTAKQEEELLGEMIIFSYKTVAKGTKIEPIPLS